MRSSICCGRAHNLFYMNRHKLILIFLAAISFAACSSSNDISDNGENGGTKDSVTVLNSNKNDAVKNAESSRLEFPHLKANSILLVHKANGEVNYSVEWDPVKYSQRWSCYQLYRSNMTNSVSRYYSKNNQYPMDPDLNSKYYLDDDYFYGSGYDHGHICPSADRRNNNESQYQTFYLTNMQPQLNSFNAAVWENMEDKVREIASRNGYTFCDTLYVCKGGTIDSENNIIKRISGKLIVPKYFFMALLVVKNGQYHAMAFWVEHKANADKDLAKYAITIDDLEAKTGMDFFCNLPDVREEKIESTPVNATYWQLK